MWLQVFLDAGTGPVNEEELLALRKQLAERLAENEKFIQELSLSWEEKLRVCSNLFILQCF